MKVKSRWIIKERNREHAHNIGGRNNTDRILRDASLRGLCLSWHLKNKIQSANRAFLEERKLQKVVRESFPRQVDKKSRGPQGERGLEFSRRKKGQTFFFLYIP